jgi:hypothetical protein
LSPASARALAIELAIDAVGAVVDYVRTVKTGWGTTTVLIVWLSRLGSRSIEHAGLGGERVGVGGAEGRGPGRGHADSPVQSKPIRPQYENGTLFW